VREVGVPWWGAVSAAAAPVLLIAGLTASARLQPASFDAFNSTVSSAAAPGAADSWVMSLTFVVVGICDVVTGLALRPAGRAGRITLVGAGLAGVLVAAFPTHLGGSLIHAWWAGIGFAGLTLWPVLARRRAPDAPWGLRPAICWSVTVTLSALTLWFAAEQASQGPLMGIAERAAGTAQTLWPLIVVMSCRRLAPARPELAADALEPGR
jgi:hypothetical membrane protein